MKKKLMLDGVNYEVRYTYEREDGSSWYVLLEATNLMGKFGDEWPVKQTFSQR